MAELTHVDAEGHVRMVDVSEKEPTDREAVAQGCITMRPETARAVVGGEMVKGNVLETARIAGIMAAKRTADLIPLCHPISVTAVEIDLRVGGDRICAESKVRISDRTGVEMEALTAVTVSLLTIYDMCKAIDRGMSIENVRLLRKSGGRSGSYQREA